jgi:hypothetical protein
MLRVARYDPRRVDRLVMVKAGGGGHARRPLHSMIDSLPDSPKGNSPK